MKDKAIITPSLPKKNLLSDLLLGSFKSFNREDLIAMCMAAGGTRCSDMICILKPWATRTLTFLSTLKKKQPVDMDFNETTETYCHRFTVCSLSKLEVEALLHNIRFG